MQNNKLFGYVLIILSFGAAVYLLSSERALMPAGYDLGVDGYLVARALIFLFILYALFKFGYFLLTKKD
ncbi:hypothetical protein [Priestia megaterium]|uniref:Uncharacterized protein n=1 Tax=Priestia megaterium TaxID=1404 RepID=A0A6M6DZI9_PRIMG|nr:hypothetical protein [Priestia megaterium]QJX80313.1 hypothetical protein FDZ14_29930 [Priestia megaterium]